MRNQRTKSPKRRNPSIEVLQKLAEQLKGIDSILPAPPSSRLEAALNRADKTDLKRQGGADYAKGEDAIDEDNLDKESDLSDEDIEGYDETDGSGSIAVEELEVAVDELLTEVNIELRERGRREVDSLSGFFERYYGANSDIAGSAVDFEDAINGYVGLVFGDNLESANELLHLMIAFVREEIQKCDQQTV